MKLPPLPTILIDTREQMPYEFAGQATRRVRLSAGDYSLLGHEGSVAVERKEKGDAWGCVGGSRSRFTDCLRRLNKIASPVLVIEASLDDFAIPPAYTRLSPAQGVGAFISWSQEYRIPVFFCPNRAYAERVTLRWLEAFWRHQNRDLLGRRG